MRVKFWGVRGSLPAPLNQEGLTAKLAEAVAGAHGVDRNDPDAIRAYLAGLPFPVGSVVGGNTTCVEVRSGEDTVVIDAGSGIRSLGLSLLAREYGRGQGTLHLFFTHAHWDHLMGFPFFKPAYVPGNRIICYAVNHHPLEYLRHLMTGPTFFPIDPGQMPASLEYVTLKEGDPVTIGALRISNIRLHHPGVAYAYRFDDGEGSFVFATDTEFKVLDDERIRAHIDFFRSADVLAYDAQFSLKDAFAYEDWGHSSAITGVDLAIRAGAKRLVTVHHDPNHTDRQIWEVAEAAQAYARLSPGGADLEVTVGYEGLEIFPGEWDGLKVAEAAEDGAIIVTLAGRLSGQSGLELKARLQRLRADIWRRPVAVDLSELAVVEPEGVAALREAATAIGDVPLPLVIPSYQAHRLGELAALGGSRWFVVYNDRASARAAIVGPAHLRLRGQIIAGRYRMTEMIASDDRAALYDVYDSQMNRPAVAQVLNPGLPHAARAHYLRSIRGWSRLHHPAFVQVLDVLPDEDGLTVAILEAPPSPTLKDYCRQASVEGRLPVALAVEIGAQLLEALSYLHGQGTAHGELRPESIYWNGRVRIGIADAAPLHLRGSSAIWLGPVAYRAPEQLAGEGASAAADLYALGLILYQLLAGIHPFESESGEVTALRQLQSEPHSLRALSPTISPGQETVVLKLLARDPNTRYASAEEASQAWCGEAERLRRDTGNMDAAA